MSIGDRVKMMRVAKGLNQSELARLVKVRPASINDIESGKTKSLKAATIIGLCRALDCSSEWLNTGRGSPTPPAPISSVDEAEIIAVFVALSEANKAALLASARALLNTQPHVPSVVDPFPVIKKAKADN